MGIEPTTSSLARTRSTAELRPLDEVSSREWPRWSAEGQICQVSAYDGCP